MKTFIGALVVFLFATSFSFGQSTTGIDTKTTIGGWRVDSYTPTTIKAYSRSCDTTVSFWYPESKKSQLFGVEFGSNSYPNINAVTWKKNFGKKILSPKYFEISGKFNKFDLVNGGSIGTFEFKIYLSEDDGDWCYAGGGFTLSVVTGWTEWSIVVVSSMPLQSFSRAKIELLLDWESRGCEIIFDEWRGRYVPGGPQIIVDGFEDTTITDVEDEPNIPTRFTLYQNYPNPFNPTTSIKYTIASIQHVKLAVYDVLGREVKILVDEEEKHPGTYEVQFDASQLPSGTYFYRLTAGSSSETRKMLLLK